MLAGCLQFDPEFGAPRRNVERASEMIRTSGADLVVLPELVTTGYRFADVHEARSLAETVPDGPSTRAFFTLARDLGTSICFGVAERVGDEVFNTAVLVAPEGLVLVYRKIHLFWDEWDIFTPGDLGFPVADLGEGTARVGIMICFDWVFPEAARALALGGADLILHPANLVLDYCQGAMETRSLENGVYSLVANRVGSEERAGKDRLVFTGRSRVISPRGEVLSSLGPEEEGLALAEVDPDLARDKSITPRNQLLDDRRPEHYTILTDTGGDD